MRRVQDFTTENSMFFSPATDLVVSLVAVLIMILSVEINNLIQLSNENDLLKLKLAKYENELDRVRENQLSLIKAVAAVYQTEAEEISNQRYGIDISNQGTYDILINNEATIQRISFGEYILFDEDDDILKLTGEVVLQKVGGVIRGQLDLISEIQIQGHANPKPTYKAKYDRSNLVLAAYRAMGVFRFLQEQLGIDPAEYLMSATTFGEYKPVQRSPTSASYNADSLNSHNSTEDMLERNKRIEILLIYRLGSS